MQDNWWKKAKTNLEIIKSKLRKKKKKKEINHNLDCG